MNLYKNEKLVCTDLLNTDIEKIKPYINKKLGVTMSKMPAKIHGCFQSHRSRVIININGYCVGKTCNGGDFGDNRHALVKILRELDFEFK